MQSAGIVEIDRSVSELDDATQQNSALVEQTPTASACLADRALGLSHSVGAFKLSDRIAA